MKNQQTRAELEGLRRSIARVTDLIQEILDQMKAAGVSSVLIHTKDAENKHIPALWKWALKARSEAELQLEMRPRRQMRMPKPKKQVAKRAAARTRPSKKTARKAARRS